MAVETVREIEIPDMTVVRAYGFGDSPELSASDLMRRFLTTVGWGAGELSGRRHFGFNNPDPSEGSPNYGYEMWLTVDDDFRLPDVSPEGISVKRHEGGLFAGLQIRGIPDPTKWHEVVLWLNGSRYRYDQSRQWLEELKLDEAGLGFVFGDEIDFDRLIFTLLSPIMAGGEPA